VTSSDLVCRNRAVVRLGSGWLPWAKGFRQQETVSDNAGLGPTESGSVSRACGLTQRTKQPSLTVAKGAIQATRCSGLFAVIAAIALRQLWR
jgi:hypothetical protein